MKRLFAALACVCIAGSPCFAAEPIFTAEDKLLVVAPHPDDESLGAAGLIQTALASGAAVKVVYLTNGDLHKQEWLHLSKRTLRFQEGFKSIGRSRAAEAKAALQSLGLSESDLVFFGYPDLGLLAMWHSNWGDEKPYKSLGTRADRVPYDDSPAYGHPYRGEAVVADLRKLIAEFKPTRVAVPAPFDRHSDHQAAYLFTSTAVLEAGMEGRARLQGYLIHSYKWPVPRDFRPGLPLRPPAAFEFGDDAWETLPLSPEMRDRKKAAIQFHASQMKKRKFLLSFVRTNELFLRVGFTRLPYASLRHANSPSAERKPHVTRAAYSLEGDKLAVELSFTGALDEIGGLRVELFGHRPDKPFASMPKLSFVLYGKKSFVSDRGKKLPDSGVRHELSAGKLTARFPLALLGEPTRLFACSTSLKSDPSEDLETWDALRIKN